MRGARWRAAAPSLAVVLAALIAACASTAPAAQRPLSSANEITLHGPLLRVQGTSFTMQVGGAAVAIRFAPAATPIYLVANATPAAIEPGSCADARFQRNAVGTLTATAMVVASSVDDACPAPSVPPPPAPPDPSPPPPPSPGSAPPRPDSDLLMGQVLSVGGGAVGIEGPQGDPQVLLIPPGVPIWFYQPAGPAALAVPSCVVVRASRGRHAVTARKIVDWPPGTSC